ncbi:hypothetical protein KUV85_03735 [Nocardioides panacisoli]|uniref:hypothetical protein n=1 Tax=Nocardioides panacisoli TaxID=627624 RepID=UPI001C63067B|nr:hypothetical protein [Nocardioides panacisoli]QYJ04805.1 hypothetical protein KUV85_03735 [Nocardioides panacisoli]
MPHHARTAPGITEPLTRPLARLLREAVLEHATTERRRAFAPVLHAGVPGRAARTFAVLRGDELDPALRVDVVEALVRPTVSRGRVPLLWLTRPDAAAEVDGEAQVDRDWVAATAAAGAELGVLLDLVVVTKHGWRDPRTGVARHWKRIRRRP